MAQHVPLQPGGVSIAGGTYRSGLQFADRSFAPKLLSVYGAENYAYFIEMIGKKEKTDNIAFYHYENRGRLHLAMQVASITGGGSAGVAAVVTFAAGSHFSSGTQSPVRVGEVVEISASGILGKVTAVNKSVASAHTATVVPIRVTDTFAPAANDWLYFHGVGYAGENSGIVENQQNLVRQVPNTVNEFRDDFKITDKAMMEKLEFEVDGQRFFKYKATKDIDKRFVNNVDHLLTFGVQNTNTALITNGALGSLGIIPQIVSGGSTLGYSAGSLAITDYQAITRALLFNGAASEVHGLVDVYQYQETMRSLFALYPQGAVLWDSVGGSAEAAAKYGFKSLEIDGFNFHWRKHLPFSPEAKYGVAPATASAYKNYGLFIPQGQFRDPVTGTERPTITVMYQEIPNIGEINAYETGGLSASNKTTDQNLVITMVTHKGIRLSAANQCVILDA